MLPSWPEKNDEHPVLVNGIPLSPLSNSSYIDALNTIRQDESEQNVYVFVTVIGGKPASDRGRSVEEVGKLIELPALSRVYDAIVALITQYSANGFSPENFGSGIQRVWCNGEIVSLEDRIRNGDVILVSIGSLED